MEKQTTALQKLTECPTSTQHSTLTLSTLQLTGIQYSKMWMWEGGKTQRMKQEA